MLRQSLLDQIARAGQLHLPGTDIVVELASDLLPITFPDDHLSKDGIGGSWLRESGQLHRERRLSHPVGVVGRSRKQAPVCPHPGHLHFDRASKQQVIGDETEDKRVPPLHQVDDRGSIGALHRIVERLVIAPVVDGGPADRGPDIIDLPVERTSVIGIGATDGTDGIAGGISLLEETQVGEVGKALGHRVVPLHIEPQPLIASRGALPMRHERMVEAEGVRLRGKAPDGLHLGEGLQPVLTCKAPWIVIKCGVVLFAKPHPPVVCIAAGEALEVAPVGVIR